MSMDRTIGYRPAWKVMLSVWRALFMRELVTRVYAGRFAWVWLLLEPVAHVVFLMVIFSTLRQRSMAGVDFSVFLAIGVVSFQLVTNVAKRTGSAVSANKALLSYRQVQIIDTVIVRVILEGGIQFIVFVLLIAGLLCAKGNLVIADPLSLVFVFVVLWLFGSGLGLIFSVLFALVPELEKIINMIFAPLYFASAVMYSLAVLPAFAQNILLWNPIVHGIELIRGAFFPGYHVVVGVELDYLFKCAVFCLLLGLMLHRHFKRKLSAL